ncbi:MAG TPA: prepilin-type N-terminal cleavage/methylation domain-containing protein [Fimbriimonadaceae bacterium]|nr:prepilin-type N-terminal cleavage/methylation domain-containing protein [Fimbriimonadaceae bacterium]HRJ97549.1 prepilin-type N-terminal cleavage/methylation domain-containing protein [Fimbriimonadaceae bacterium]
MRKAFTLIELLVVIAIIAILAAILFPVFAQAKAAAKKAACVSNAKQYALAHEMYLPDNDSTYVLIQWTNSYSVTSVPPDNVIGVILQPYIKNIQILASPGDPATEQQRVYNGGLPNPDTSTNRAGQRDFNLAIKSDYGYNTQYFCVMGAYCPELFRASGTNESAVEKKAETILAVNSVWDRVGGRPVDGGNWGIDPPCRQDQDGTDTFPALPAGCTGRWYWLGWQPTSPNAWNVFGGAWPWHAGNAVVTWADGHVSVRKISTLTAGCNVLNTWGGRIFDKDRYLWDLR